MTSTSVRRYLFSCTVHQTENVEGISYQRRLLVLCSNHFIRSDIRVSDTCQPQKILDFLFTCIRLQGYQRYCNDPIL